MPRPYGLQPRPWAVCLLLLLSFLISPRTCLAMPDLFTDPVDGQFDASKYLMEKHGVLPVPIIITEPAIGYGAGASLVYFHRKKDDSLDRVDVKMRGEPIKMPRPSTTAAFGFYTQSDTWLGGAAHRGIWKDDHIRYIGALAKMSINIDFYRDDRAIDMNIDGGALLQDIQFRIADSDFFLGANYTYFDSDSSFNSDRNLDWIPDNLGQTTVAGLGFVMTYDSRNNIFTPTQGQNIEIVFTGYGPAVGGDDTFQEFEWDAQTYHPLGEKFNLNFRFGGSTTGGDVPFFSLPYIDLRGIPAMRYQGQTAGEIETELHWKVTKRWDLVGFIGVGRTEAGDTNTTSESGIVAGGAGFRYLLARALGMQVGIDIAQGPEDTAFYIQVGSSW